MHLTGSAIAAPCLIRDGWCGCPLAQPLETKPAHLITLLSWLYLGSQLEVRRPEEKIAASFTDEADKDPSRPPPVTRSSSPLAGEAGMRGQQDHH